MKNYKGITEKQKIARTTNFAKARIKAAYSACRWAIDLANINKECKDYLKDASMLILNALDDWKK